MAASGMRISLLGPAEGAPTDSYKHQRREGCGVERHVIDLLGDRGGRARGGGVRRGSGRIARASGSTEPAAPRESAAAV